MVLLGGPGVKSSGESSRARPGGVGDGSPINNRGPRGGSAELSSVVYTPFVEIALTQRAVRHEKSETPTPLWLEPREMRSSGSGTSPVLAVRSPVTSEPIEYPIDAVPLVPQDSSRRNAPWEMRAMRMILSRTLEAMDRQAKKTSLSQAPPGDRGEYFLSQEVEGFTSRGVTIA
ncbi:hypothetical protein WN55_00799 [Dufourea novaeangliae]|uniref:Uncharacterized protein n=1 Tax=Dufourea novaeangliae TaxID=178035 RepID=A0A154PCN9_DUFNO|nr:hypothetical protein WN55_00799 [Dufourea novaeangliae]